MKQVRFRGETVIENRGGDSQTSNLSSPGKIIDTQFGDEINVCSEMGDNGGCGEAEIGGGGVERAEINGGGSR